MKTISSFCLLAGMLLLSACSKEVAPGIQKKFSGSWKFTKVKEREKGEVFGQNITSDYDGAILQMNEDHTARLTQNNGSVLQGTWTVEYDNTAYSNNTYSNKAIYNLKIDLSNTVTGESKSFDSQYTKLYTSFGQKQLYLRDRSGHETIRYRLKAE